MIDEKSYQVETPFRTVWFLYIFLLRLYTEFELYHIRIFDIS